MIKAESPDLDKLVRRLALVSTNFPRDSQRALGTFRRIAPAEATKAATAVYGVGRNRIASGWLLTVLDNAKLAFALVGVRAPISLVAYGARASKGAGLVVQVLRAKGQTIIPSGFIANSPGGNRLPWVRTGQPKRVMKTGRYEGRRREPIKALHGPSLADMLLNPKVFEPLRDNAIARLSKELVRLINRNLERRG